MTAPRVWILSLAALLGSACGSSLPPEEEVTASWTSGDDAPLEISVDDGAPAAE